MRPHLFLSGDGRLPLLQRGEQLRDPQLEAPVCRGPAAGLRLDGGDLSLGTDGDQVTSGFWGGGIQRPFEGFSPAAAGSLGPSLLSWRRAGPGTAGTVLPF